MANRAEQNLALLDAETRRLERTCRHLGPRDQHRPTLCAGWDVAHVLTHLSRNADALANLVRWAVDGIPRDAYVSEEQRDTDIEAGARRSMDELVTDVTESAARFRELAGALTGPAGDAEVQTRTGNTVKGHQVVAMRIIEVVFHHVDLDAGYTFDDADPAWVARTLKRGVRQWEATDQPPALTLHPHGLEPLELAGGGTEVLGTPGQLLRWLARGRADGLRSAQPLPSPPPWA